MGALPYMPLYVADYLADTAHLTALENGAYLMLIMNYWQRGKELPAGDKQLARIARVTDDEWREIKPALQEFFEETDGAWVHHRIEHELEKVKAKSEQASSAGRTSAQRKSNGRSTDVQRTFNHTDTDTDTKKEREEPARVKILEEKEVVDASTHKETIRELLATRKLTDWEKQFLGSLASTRTLTRFQREKLDAIIGAKEFNTADPPPEPFNGKSNGRVWVKAGTEAFDAWDDWWRKHKGKSAPRDTKGGWYFETEYPQEQAA
jgi:uncharacterized protein YdaU (DUF1376 family)